MKLSTVINTLNSDAKLNVKNPIIESYLDNLPSELNSKVARGEPILLKAEANNLYLGVKKFTKQQVLLSTLENTSCEFIFVLEPTSSNDQLSLEDSFQVKSLLGGSITAMTSVEGPSLEDLIYKTSEEKLEDLDQLAIEEAAVSEGSSRLIKVEPVNSFIGSSRSLSRLSAKKLHSYDAKLVSAMSQALSRLIDYQIFLQDWGNLLGKALKDSHFGDREEENERNIQDEVLYYDFEEASETQDKLIHRSDDLLAILVELRDSMLYQNSVKDLSWNTQIEQADLPLKMKQKAVVDLALIDYLVLLIKTIFAKTYDSIDFERVFGVKFDNERKRDTEGSARKTRMRRLLLNDRVDWRKIRQSPQGVCRLALDKILIVSLEIIYLTCKNYPPAVRALAPFTDLFYYSLSFHPISAIKILQEVAKFTKEPSDTQVVFSDKIVNWISKIEVMGERRHNLDDQIQVLRVLNNMCTDYGLGKDLLAIQKRIRIQLFNIGTNPMKRGVIFFQSDQSSMVNLLLGESKSGKGSKEDLHMKADKLIPLKNSESKGENLLFQGKDMLESPEKKSEEAHYSVKIFKPSNSRPL